jgi:hypothetical protein
MSKIFSIKIIILILTIPLYFSGCTGLPDFNLPDNSGGTAPNVEIEKVIQPGPTEGKDTYVYSGLRDNNYGEKEKLEIGDDAYIQKRYRSYLQFDVSSVPDNAVIIEARLGLYLFSVNSLSCTSVSAHQVNSPWEEYGITWDYQPAFSEDPTYTEEYGCGINEFHYWEITNLVAGWVNKSINNYGVMLQGGPSSPYTYYSSEYTSPNPRPKLIVKYYLPKQ